MEIDCALTQPAHSRFWENVVSQARYSRQGQVVRSKLDQQHIGHFWWIRKSLEAIQSPKVGLAPVSLWILLDTSFGVTPADDMM